MQNTSCSHMLCNVRSSSDTVCKSLEISASATPSITRVRCTLCFYKGSHLNFNVNHNLKSTGTVHYSLNTVHGSVLMQYSCKS